MISIVSLYSVLLRCVQVINNMDNSIKSHSGHKHEVNDRHNMPSLQVNVVPVEALIAACCDAFKRKQTHHLSSTTQARIPSERSVEIIHT